jgi:nucleoside-diphosphate-sugar epimerase
MNVLLTGASGFIGKRCAMILLEKGAAVTALVRNPARLDPSLAAKVTVVASDLTSDEFAVRLDGLGAYDACVHCAANLKFYARQDEIDRVNVQATGRLLDWCARNSVKRFVFASSLEAIGPVARTRSRNTAFPNCARSRRSCLFPDAPSPARC